MSRSIVIRTVTALCFVLSMISLAPSVFAEINNHGVIVKQVKVFYGDLKLDSVAGAETLIIRLSVAAKKACINEWKRGSIAWQQTTKRQENQCRSNALHEAIATLNHPVVTMVYAGKTDKAPIRVASR